MPEARTPPMPRRQVQGLPGRATSPEREAAKLVCSGYYAVMRLPAALLPLRHSTFRRLWLANVVAWLGTWLQNTGAGWLMTSLAPPPPDRALGAGGADL